MNYELTHPRDMLVAIMHRIYAFGMTTTSGGNISIRDEQGSIWITPAGVDKGTLRPQDIVRVRDDGTVEGMHKPSSEYPFHKAIYQARPDIRSVLHAHPSALVSFSIVRKIPDIRIIPQAEDICGTVGYASYALPGSPKLGEKIAATFREGYDTVLLENHGVACGGKTILQAFQRFETLDFCARLIIKARTLGDYKALGERDLDMFDMNKHFLPEFVPTMRTNQERELRATMCALMRRAYEQRLMPSTQGTLSARLGRKTFLITPYGIDRYNIEIGDIVMVHDGHREVGKLPSRAVILHKTIYDQHEEIAAIVSAQAPNAMAYSVTEAPFNTRTIPESYIMLRDVPRVAYGPQYNDEAALSRMLSDDCPVLLLENDAIMATGQSLIQAYDRLEVAEFTARSLISAAPLGGLVAINDEETAELEQHFLGKPAR